MNDGNILEKWGYDINIIKTGSSMKRESQEFHGEISYGGGKYLLASYRAEIYLLDTDMNLIGRFDSRMKDTRSNAFFLDQETLAICDNNGTIFIYEDLKNPEAPTLTLGELKSWGAEYTLMATKKSAFVTAHPGNNIVRTWQKTGGLRKTYTAEAPIDALAQNTSSDTLFIATSTSISAASLSTMNLKNKVEYESPVCSMVYCDDSDTIVSYHPEEKILNIWPWKEKEPSVTKFPLEKWSYRYKLVYLGENRVLLSNLKDDFYCYSLNDGKLLWEKETKITPESYKIIYAGSHENKLLLIHSNGTVYQETSNPGEMELLFSLDKKYDISCADISFECNVLAAGSYKGEISYYDLDTGEILASIDALRGEVKTIHIADPKYAREVIVTDLWGNIAGWTRIRNTNKFMNCAIDKSALVIKSNSRGISSRLYGPALPGDPEILEIRTRKVPLIVSAQWAENNTDQGKIMTILAETEEIPDKAEITAFLYRSTEEGSTIGPLVTELKGTINGGKAEFNWAAKDIRDNNEIGDLFISYTLKCPYCNDSSGESIKISFPEIIETFWYNENCSSAEPAILCLTVKDIAPEEEVELYIYPNESRAGTPVIMDGFHIGEMENPIYIKRNQMAAAGLAPGHQYYINIKTAESILYNVKEPLLYQ